MKYFLALFYILSSQGNFAMETTCQQPAVDITIEQLDTVTIQILKHYLKLKEKNILNEDGVNLVIHESKSTEQMILYVQVEEESRHPIAQLLRREANKGLQTTHTHCKGSLDVVHRSNEDYKSPKVELGVCNVSAQTSFTIEEFEHYCGLIESK